MSVFFRVVSAKRSVESPESPSRKGDDRLEEIEQGVDRDPDQPEGEKK